jgi:hypothetical protein
LTRLGRSINFTREVPSCSVTWTISKPSFPYRTGTFAYQHPIPVTLA